MGRAGILTRTGTLAVAAAAGGAVALGGAELFGKLGSRTTIQQVSPLPGRARQRVPLDAAGRARARWATPRSTGGTRPAWWRSPRRACGRRPADPFGFFGPQTTTSQALGSGFVIDKAGHIVTNYHVIAGAQKVQVSFSGQDQIRATVVGKDASTDLAVLKIDAHASALTPLPLGDSATVVVGQPVVAIGNPFGLTRTLTSGVVSAVQRHIASPNQSQEDAIQTDASINHGNSGGPLIDMHGQVIGVTSQITTGGTGNDGNVGIGFAIPSNTVRTIAAQLITSGKALHAYLGVDTFGVTQRLARIFNLPVRHGLLVQQVTQGQRSREGGHHARQDTRRRAGHDVQARRRHHHQGRRAAGHDAGAAARRIAGHQPGDRLELEIYRQRQAEARHGDARQPPGGRPVTTRLCRQFSSPSGEQASARVRRARDPAGRTRCLSG